MSRVMVDESFMRDETPVSGALDALLKARVVEYTDCGATGNIRRQGVVGQSMEDSLAVEVDGLGYHYVDHEKLVPLLVAAVQELAAKRTRQVRKTEE